MKRILEYLTPALLLLTTGCGSSDNTPASTATPTATATRVGAPTATPLPATVPSFDAANFSDPTRIDNVLHPLVPGVARTYLATTDEDEIESIIVEVLDETRRVNGIDARVVRDRVYVDGLLIEDTFDWFAQDDAGNVWYLGEETEAYDYDDDDNLIEVDTAGAWEAGKDVANLGSVAHAGYQMLADPRPGALYHQEFYAGEAEDMAEVLALDVAVTLEDGSTYSTVKTRDFTPLEPGIDEHKYFAPGIGFVLEEKVGSSERVEYLGTFDTTSAALPPFDPAEFSAPTQVDNPYWPLVPGTTYTYEAELDDGEIEVILVEVLDATRVVAGIECRVVRDRVYIDDVLIEDTRDWYAQDDAGNVWYMGEDVDDYLYDEDGQLIEIAHEGAWETGKDVADVGHIAQPGFLMPANPQPGVSYYQEFYRTEAEDMARIVALGVDVEIDGEIACSDCLQVLEWNPTDPSALAYKYYEAGIGSVVEIEVTADEVVVLQEID